MSNHYEDVCGVILAGGQSTRMGRDKALLEVVGKPLIRHQADLLHGLTDAVVISVNEAGRYAFLELPSVSDVFPGQGPLAGLHAAMLHSHRMLFLVLACDMPLVRSEFLRMLVESAGGFDAVIPMTSDGQLHPLCALYRRTCLAVVEQCLQSKENRLLSFIGNPNLRVRRILPEEGGFSDIDLSNINDPKDLSNYLDSAKSTLP